MQKIPKSKWLKLSEDEKRYYELEYKKAFEKNKKLMIISTRIITLLLIFVLFFIGLVMIHQTKTYKGIKSKYGSQAYCYLCGLENMKQCSCVYQSNNQNYDKYKSTKEYREYLAKSNAEKCVGTKIIGTQGNNTLPNLTGIIPLK